MKCDFHVHTHCSYDSTSSPKEIIEVALEKGIDCLAITDHDTIKGVAEVKRWGSGTILIIPGIEIKSRKGDILGLNIRNEIPSGLSVRETIKEIKKQGGVAIIPHPFSHFTPFRAQLDSILTEIDGLEALNASIFGPENEKARRLAEEKRIPFTAGSDAHFPEFVGEAYLEIPGEGLSVEEVLGAVAERKAKIRGKEINLLRKIIDHTKRNITKFKD